MGSVYHSYSVRDIWSISPLHFRNAVELSTWGKYCRDFQVRQDDYSGGVDSSFFKEDDLGKEEKTPSGGYNFLASAGGKENLGQVLS